MFLPNVHAEKSIPALQQFIRDNPLGILTTAIPSSTYPTIQSSHIPFVFDSQDDDSPGTLRGHMARQNPQAKAMIEALQAQSTTASQLEEEVLILFNGPAHHYVTPKFYTETKPDTGKVVPTWNYSAVQAYGKITVYHDAKSEHTNEYLTKQLHELSQQSETEIMGYTGKDGKADSWKVTDAPDRYIELKKKGIIGIEIRIERLEGKAKMSQEMAEGDRRGVVDGFTRLGTENGNEMARTVEERGELRNKAR